MLRPAIPTAMKVSRGLRPLPLAPVLSIGICTRRRSRVAQGTSLQRLLYCAPSNPSPTGVAEQEEVTEMSCVISGSSDVPELTWGNLQAVLEAADKQHLQPVLEACEQFIITNPNSAGTDAALFSFDRSLLELLWRNNLHSAFAVLTGVASETLFDSDALIPADMLRTVVDLTVQHKQQLAEQHKQRISELSREHSSAHELLHGDESTITPVIEIDDQSQEDSQTTVQRLQMELSVACNHVERLEAHLQQAKASAEDAYRRAREDAEQRFSEYLDDMHFELRRKDDLLNNTRELWQHAVRTTHGVVTEIAQVKQKAASDSAALALERMKRDTLQRVVEAMEQYSDKKLREELGVARHTVARLCVELDKKRAFDETTHPQLSELLAERQATADADAHTTHQTETDRSSCDAEMKKTQVLMKNETEQRLMRKELDVVRKKLETLEAKHTSLKKKQEQTTMERMRAKNELKEANDKISELRKAKAKEKTAADAAVKVANEKLEALQAKHESVKKILDSTARNCHGLKVDLNEANAKNAKLEQVVDNIAQEKAAGDREITALKKSHATQIEEEAMKMSLMQQEIQQLRSALEVANEKLETWQEKYECLETILKDAENAAWGFCAFQLKLKEAKDAKLEQLVDNIAQKKAAGDTEITALKQSHATQIEEEAMKMSLMQEEIQQLTSSLEVANEELETWQEKYECLETILQDAENVAWAFCELQLNLDTAKNAKLEQLVNNIAQEKAAGDTEITALKKSHAPQIEKEAIKISLMLQEIQQLRSDLEVASEELEALQSKYEWLKKILDCTARNSRKLQLNLNEANAKNAELEQLVDNIAQEKAAGDTEITALKKSHATQIEEEAMKISLMQEEIQQLRSALEVAEKDRDDVREQLKLLETGTTQKLLQKAAELVAMKQERDNARQMLDKACVELSALRMHQN